MSLKHLSVSAGALLLILALHTSVAQSAPFTTVLPNLPATPTFSVSTVPGNGDVNPYGVAFVPAGFPAGGLLSPGDILVSNFNNSSNAQGTGTTIVRIAPDGTQSVFFQGETGLGLTTALGVLKRGFVLVGNVPTTDGAGTCTPGPDGEMTGVEQGSLLVLDRDGKLVKTLTSADFLDGPWDLTIKDEGKHAQVFVSNVLNGTVTRLDIEVSDAGHKDSFEVKKQTQIASGYEHRCDPAALVVGPTGLAFDRKTDTLFVASTGDNEIFAIGDATHTMQDNGTGAVAVQDSTHLHGPLGLVLASNGDFITSQGDAVNSDPNQPSEIVEFDSKGAFVSQFSVDSAAGAAFGIALERSPGGFTFAAVDDALNVLDVWVVKKDEDM